MSPNYFQEKSGLEELRLLIAGAWLFVAAGFTINFQPLSVASVFHLGSSEKAFTISSEAHQISPTFVLANFKDAVDVNVGTLLSALKSSTLSSFFVLKT